MKKLLTIMLLLVVMTAGAQDIQFNEEGCYEQKKVVSIENATVSDLYTRALEAVSDWAGSQQKTKGSIDVQDKDKGLVVYKGQLYIGFYKAQFDGWHIYADFTLKVRCKDGRAQLAMTVPSLSYYWNSSLVETTAPINEIYPEFKHKTKFPIKKASLLAVPDAQKEVSSVIDAITKRMTSQEEDF